MVNISKYKKKSFNFYFKYTQTIDFNYKNIPKFLILTAKIHTF